MAIKVYSLRR